MNNRVYTIGHSTRSAAEFIKILQRYGVEMVVDVRKIAKSLHNPQFAEEELRRSLAGHGIAYMRIEALGGLRRRMDKSGNTGWKNLSFRAYADYMQTGEFQKGITELVDHVATRQSAIMCAEAVPWRCHRSLIGDALIIRNIEVVDILSETASRPHTLTSFAKVDGLSIRYP